MEQNERQFINELGNNINVRVVKQDIGSVSGVLISITGPTSITTNHITKLEAEVLCDSLVQLLGKQAV